MQNGEAVPPGTPLANGGRIFHRELEEDLADFTGKEACHIFSAGYLACASAITGFIDRKDIIFADKNLHSSLWSGIQLTGANCERFAHNHPEHLRDLLSAENPSANKAIVLEGIYSMEGHIARLPELVEVAQEFNAFVVLDDAHGIGVLGKQRTRNCRSFCSDQGSGCNLRKFLKIVFRDGRFCLLIKGCNRLYAEPFKTDHFFCCPLSYCDCLCSCSFKNFPERTRTS